MSTSTPAQEQLTQPPGEAAGRSGPSRRRLLAGTGLFGAGAVAGGLTGYLTGSQREPASAPGTQTVPFYGAHQAGIITAAQDRLAFGTLNVASTASRTDVRDLLREWTNAAARMAAGRLAGEDSRGYSFTDGIDPQAGTLLGGLFFIAFMKNPGQFIQLQRSLADDALNEYIHHTGSAVFACPPGLRPGQHWGDALFS